jgi:hypothetical protein
LPFTAAPDIANIYGTVRVEVKVVHGEGEGSFSHVGRVLMLTNGAAG